MLKQEHIKKMATLLGIDKTKLAEALGGADEVDIEIPEVKVFTTDGLRKLESDKYEAGKEAGLEISIKEFKKEHSLDFKGKDLNSLKEHLESKTDTEGRVKKLQQNLLEAENKAREAEERAGKIEVMAEIHGSIPAEYNGLSKKELQAIAEANGFTFKKEGSKVVPYRNGEKVREERTQEDVDAPTALKNFFEVEKKMTVAGKEPAPDDKKGRGGRTEPAKTGAAPVKRSEIEKEWTIANPDKHIGGMEYGSHFATKLKELKEAGQEVVMD